MPNGAKDREKEHGFGGIDSATKELERLCEELGGAGNLEGGDIIAACRKIRAACSQGGGWGIRSRQIGEAISRAEDKVIRVEAALQELEKKSTGWMGGAGGAQEAEVERLKRRVEELEADHNLRPSWPMPPILGVGSIQGGDGSGGGEKSMEDEVYVDANGQVCIR